MSKWHIIPLDQDQLMYAAIDVYVSKISLNFYHKYDLLL